MISTGLPGKTNDDVYARQKSINRLTKTLEVLKQESKDNMEDNMDQAINAIEEQIHSLKSSHVKLISSEAIADTVRTIEVTTETIKRLVPNLDTALQVINNANAQSTLLDDINKLIVPQHTEESLLAEYEEMRSEMVLSEVKSLLAEYEEMRSEMDFSAPTHSLPSAAASSSGAKKSTPTATLT